MRLGGFDLFKDAFICMVSLLWMKTEKFFCFSSTAGERFGFGFLILEWALLLTLLGLKIMIGVDRWFSRIWLSLIFSVNFSSLLGGCHGFKF